MSFRVSVTGFVQREHARVLAEQLARQAPPSLSVTIEPDGADERDRTIETIHPVPTTSFEGTTVDITTEEASDPAVEASEPL